MLVAFSRPSFALREVLALLPAGSRCTRLLYARATLSQYRMSKATELFTTLRPMFYTCVVSGRIPFPLPSYPRRVEAPQGMNDLTLWRPSSHTDRWTTPN